MTTAIDVIRALLHDAPPAEGDRDLTPFGSPQPSGPGACMARVNDDPLAYACTRPAGHGGNWHVAGDGQQVLATWGTLL